MAAPVAVRAFDPRIATLGGALIALVVIGHMIEKMPGRAAETTYLWIYMFHMPAFIWLSGYMTRLARDAGWRTALTRLLFPYVVLQLIHALLISTLSGNPVTLDLAYPGWALWYFLSLFYWRLSARVLARWWMLPVTFAAALAVGLNASFSHDYSVARTVAFSPFFVAGLLWRASWTEWLAQRAAWAGLVALALAAGLAVWIAPFASRRWWYFSAGYQLLDQGGLEGAAIRAVILLLGAVLTLAFIAVAARPVGWLGSIGAGTLSVYILHPIVLMPIRVFGPPTWWHGPLAVVIAFVVGVGFAYLASRTPVRAALRPIADARWWIPRMASRRDT